MMFVFQMSASKTKGDQSLASMVSSSELRAAYSAYFDRLAKQEVLYFPNPEVKVKFIDDALEKFESRLKQKRFKPELPEPTGSQKSRGESEKFPGRPPRLGVSKSDDSNFNASIGRFEERDQKFRQDFVKFYNEWAQGLKKNETLELTSAMDTLAYFNAVYAVEIADYSKLNGKFQAEAERRLRAEIAKDTMTPSSVDATVRTTALALGIIKITPKALAQK